MLDGRDRVVVGDRRRTGRRSRRRRSPSRVTRRPVRPRSTRSVGSNGIVVLLRSQAAPVLTPSRQPIVSFSPRSIGQNTERLGASCAPASRVEPRPARRSLSSPAIAGCRPSTRARRRPAHDGGADRRRHRRRSRRCAAASRPHPSPSGGRPLAEADLLAPVPRPGQGRRDRPELPRARGGGGRRAPARPARVREVAELGRRPRCRDPLGSGADRPGRLRGRARGRDRPTRAPGRASTTPSTTSSATPA